jgi:hypothetical protein
VHGEMLLIKTGSGHYWVFIIIGVLFLVRGRLFKVLWLTGFIIQILLVKRASFYLLKTGKVINQKRTSVGVEPEILTLSLSISYLTRLLSRSSVILICTIVLLVLL